MGFFSKIKEVILGESQNDESLNEDMDLNEDVETLEEDYALDEEMEYVDEALSTFKSTRPNKGSEDLVKTAHRKAKFGDYDPNNEHMVGNKGAQIRSKFKSSGFAGYEGDGMDDVKDKKRESHDKHADSDK